MIEVISDTRNQAKLGQRWWIKFRIDGKLCIAKVYDLPSKYGINNGRVSKLTISSTPFWEGFSTCIYAYDRGLDFDNAPLGLVAKVLDFCENLDPAL